MECVHLAGRHGETETLGVGVWRGGGAIVTRITDGAVQMTISLDPGEGVDEIVLDDAAKSWLATELEKGRAVLTSA